MAHDVDPEKNDSALTSPAEDSFLTIGDVTLCDEGDDDLSEEQDTVAVSVSVIEEETTPLIPSEVVTDTLSNKNINGSDSPRIPPGIKTPPTNSGRDYLLLYYELKKRFRAYTAKQEIKFGTVNERYEQLKEKLDKELEDHQRESKEFAERESKLKAEMTTMENRNKELEMKSFDIKIPVITTTCTKTQSDNLVTDQPAKETESTAV